MLTTRVIDGPHGLPSTVMPLPSKRDYAELRRRLTTWLASQLPAGAAPQVGELTVPEGTGMSSETLLFEAHWTERGEARGGRYVARMAPEMTDYPVFPSYDLELQHRCLRLVRARSDVPVPDAPWLELDETPLGSPFFVMSRIEGVVPADMPPYVFGGWLAEASAGDRARLQRNAVGVLARLHDIDVTGADASFLDRPEWGATPLDQHLAYQRWYYDWAREGVDYPIIERTFAWLEQHRPLDEGPVVLNWGDSRIGNIMWRDFSPVAVLDWEMAALGAPEVDIAWMIFLHRFFQDMAERYGMPGIPAFMQRDAVVRDYEEQCERKVQSLEFYEMFAALRFAIVSVRTSARAIAYGDMQPPPSGDVDDLIMHRPLIDKMLDGSYWS
jgi:aminoglycoside phosphotransferase (APT) family kinase protein